jgi:hypothetical protein
MHSPCQCRIYLQGAGFILTGLYDCVQFAALLSELGVNRQPPVDCAQKGQLLVGGLVCASNCATSMRDGRAQVLDLQAFAICIISKSAALKMASERVISARDPKIPD